MKSILSITSIAVTVLLAGCTATGTPSNSQIGTATNVGMNVIKMAVDNKCRSELESQKAWRIARVAMTPQQENQMQTKICGCVSEQAPQHVTVVDMTNAAIDPTYRAQLVTKVVAKSLQSCYGSIVTSK